MRGFEKTPDIMTQTHRRSSTGALLDFLGQSFEPAMEPMPELLAEISKTALGYNLLKFLRENNVEILLDSIFPCAGLMSIESKKLYVDKSLTLAEKLHVFAHEARHFAQFLPG